MDSTAFAVWAKGRYVCVVWPLNTKRPLEQVLPGCVSRSRTSQLGVVDTSDNMGFFGMLLKPGQKEAVEVPPGWCLQLCTAAIEPGTQKVSELLGYCHTS